MLEDVIDGLPKALEISPIKTHGTNLQSRQMQIKDKLAKLRERIEVQFTRYYILSKMF